MDHHGHRDYPNPDALYLSHWELINEREISMMTKTLRTGGLFLAVSLILLGPIGFQIDNLVLAAEAQGLQKITLKIEGMDCGTCVKDIRSALLNVPGVKAAEVKVKKRWLFFNDFSDARAVVEFEQGKTTIEALVKAVEKASNAMFTYQASVMPEE